jgi:hypothetical protein
VQATQEQLQAEALGRALQGQSLSNWPAILVGFVAKGIPEDQIRPRENVFTYHAWRALGRQVRKGEHGVKVVTFVAVQSAEDEDAKGEGAARKRRGYRRPWTPTVFHVSQTDPVRN